MDAPEFKSKLMRQGKWQQFDRLHQDIMASGVTAGKAYIEARRKWAQASEAAAAGDVEFPPGTRGAGRVSAPVGAVSSGPNESALAAAVESPQKRTGYLADAEWVYQNIGNEFVDPKEAPSPGAWWLLEQARAEPKVLREALMLIAKRSEEDATEGQIQADCVKTEQELLRTMERIKHVRVD